MNDFLARLERDLDRASGAAPQSTARLRGPFVFLDIDGVLATRASISAAKGHRGNVATGREEPYCFDAECVKRLNGLLRGTGAKVVVSSGWRAVYTRDELQAIFVRQGLVAEIVGETPQLTGRPGSIRGWEITAWLKAHALPGARYVVLDDRDDMGAHWPCLVRTTMEQGLTDECVGKARQVLGYA